MSALIDGPYRYNLSRVLADTGITVNVIGLNPSTADAELDDPTIRRCMGFARGLGARVLWMTNMYAYRSTDPNKLTDIGMLGAVGPHNPAWLYYLAAKADIVVCAWGDHPMARAASDGTVANLGTIEKWCWGLTKNHSPKHPLYLPKTTELIRFG